MAVKVGNKYEWVRGDYEGNIDTVKEIINGFIIFESNRRCNVDVFEEFLLPYNGNSNINQQLNAQYTIETSGNQSSKGVTTVQFEQDITNNAGVIYETPSIKTTQQNDGTFKEVDNYSNIPPKKEEIPKNNPITLLINQSSKDDCDIPINYKLKLPKKSVYTLIKDSFDNIDVDNEILESLMLDININELRDNFKKELLEKIKLHYK